MPKMPWINAMALIAEIRKQKYKPNNWEENFLAGFEITDKTQRGWGECGLQSAPLTSKEAAALQNIYAKSVGGGIYVK